MNKRKTLIKIFFILVMGIPELGIAQVNDENIRLNVLHKNKIGKEFIFGKWNEKGGTETSLTYLGILKSNNGKIYKIMNYIWTWGLSYRSTNRILIFNGKNKYLGNYYIDRDSDLPKEIKNGVLIFNNTDSECDKKIFSKVSFKNGLPKKIFVECKNGYGTSYNFDGTN